MPTSTDRPPETLAAALAILQTRLPHIAKDQAANIKPGFSYRYADLAAISKALLPLMGELGLSFTSRPTLSVRHDDVAQFVLLYQLLHVSGEDLSGEYPLPQGGTPQQIGSAITYARRYCLCAVTGVAADDDDDDAAAAEAAAKPKRGRSGSQPLKGAALREHNAMRRDGEQHDGKLERGITEPDPDDPWQSVDANGERRTQGDLPGKPYPPGSRQLGALQAHFKRLGFEDHDRDERLNITALLAGRTEPIASAKDLTQKQVQRAVKEIEKCRDRTQLMTRVADLQAEVPA